MTRGFITIATGKDHYCEIAANLLKSYRYFSENPLPFAIIAEEENKYTDLFDYVIITKESTHSFMDKFLLMKLCPFDETIFLDADILAFGDLNRYFDFFKNATDFSAVGNNMDLTDNNGAWYNIGDIGEYGKLIDYKCRVHAGVMFIRKSEKLKKLYDDSMKIIADYDKLHFLICEKSKDEGTLGISLPMNNMKTVTEDSEIMAFFSCLKEVNADMLNKKLSYSIDGVGYIDNGLLLHYGTYYTYAPLYRFNAMCLNLLHKKKLSIKDKILYQYKLKYYMMMVCYHTKRFFRRVINKLLQQNKDI